MDLVAEFAALHKQLHESVGAQATPAVAKVPTTTTEVAVVSEVVGREVRVQREGQTVSTRRIVLASDVPTPTLNARVELTKLADSINTAYISGLLA